MVTIIVPRFVLVTVEIDYYRPDFPSLIQTFGWQVDDQIPNFPRVNKFLKFWQTEIDAVIASVQVATSENGSTWRRGNFVRVC